MRHPDPQVQWFARKLGRAQSEVGRVSVSKGADTTRTVGHIIVTRQLDIAMPELGRFNDVLGIDAGPLTTAVSQFEVYLSKSALQLTALAKAKSPQDPSKTLIFVELEDPARPDPTSGRFFDIVARPGYRLSDFQGDTMFVAGILGRALGVNKEGYTDLVKGAFAGSPPRFLEFSTITDAAAVTLLDALKPVVDKVSSVFQQGTMPQELWNPERMPQDFRHLISGLGRRLDRAITDTLTELEKIPHLSVVQDMREWAGAGAIRDVLEQIAKIESLWNDALDFLGDAARFIRSVIPQTEDVIGTTIGYLCGLWDGVIQAAAGLFETASLGMTLLKASIELRRNAQEAGRFIREAFDEIVQILSRIKWRKVWQMIEQELWPMARDFFEASLDSLADTVARSPSSVGYYTGFMVYNIAETFFPPLKAHGLARAIRAADLTADFSRKVT